MPLCVQSRYGIMNLAFLTISGLALVDILQYNDSLLNCTILWFRHLYYITFYLVLNYYSYPIAIQLARQTSYMTDKTRHYCRLDVGPLFHYFHYDNCVVHGSQTSDMIDKTRHYCRRWPYHFISITIIALCMLQILSLLLLNYLFVRRHGNFISCFNANEKCAVHKYKYKYST